MTVDLSKLPAPEVVETLSYETLLAQFKADLKTRFPELEDDLESEPVIKILEVAAYRETLIRQRVNDAARGVMLATAGGTDLDQLAALFGVTRLEDETDAALRLRTQLSLEGFSVAGPSGGYRFHALSVAGVKDAYVDSPTPGTVRVTVLSSTGNGAADGDLIAAVRGALSDETVRPLCDTVMVMSATINQYQVTAEIRVETGPDANTVLAAARASVRKAVDGAHRLGAGAPLSLLYGSLHVSGVRAVTLTSPAADVAATDLQAAYCTQISVTQASS